MVGRWACVSALDTSRRRVLEIAMGRTPSCFLGIPMRMAEEMYGEWCGGRCCEDEL
jgi:hypothetical protein